MGQIKINKQIYLFTELSSNYDTLFQRSSILEALAKVQASEELLNQLTSIAQSQTKGLKRHVAEEKIGINSIAGGRKKRIKLMQIEKNFEKPECTDPNVVGFEVCVP